MREAKYQWTALAAASHMLLCVLTVVAMSAFEPGAFKVVLILAFGAGLLPGILVAVIDRRRPVAAIAVLPLTFVALILIMLIAYPSSIPGDTTLLDVLLPGLGVPLAVFVSAFIGTRIGRWILREFSPLPDPPKGPPPEQWVNEQDFGIWRPHGR